MKVIPVFPEPARGRWAAAVIAGLLALSAEGWAMAPRPPSGERLYARHCANCHGARGEGVKDKYAEALQGDWSVEKLSRYVAENMPDDAPGTLGAGEAGAVSAYLHDAFYSREARQRLRPSRMELARLTGEQHQLTVADLLRSLEGRDGPEVPGTGLEGTYYNAARRGGFDRSKQVHQAVEAVLEQDFREGGVVRAALGAATEFSLQWRGSIVVDETGEYEFIARTPNSVRVWINSGLDPAEARIDASVSNPADPDHRTTVRLLGGRRYPIAVDYWALPGKAGSPPPSLSLRWKPPHGVERTIPARHLSPTRVAPTLVLTTRFPAEDSSEGYERSTTVSKAWEEATTAAAFEVANHVVRRLDRLAGSRAGDPSRGEKLETLAVRFLELAWRRPLGAEERRREVRDRFRAAPDAETAVRRMVLLALKSPQFLYPEVRSGVAETGAEARAVASRLSYILWDSMPDAELRAAADAGRLIEDGSVRREAERLVGDPRARAKLAGFFQHWLQLRYVEDLGKDPLLYPDFSPEIIEDLRTSLHLFLDRVAWSQASDFRELLRSGGLFVNARLARFYGLPAPAEDGFSWVEAPAGERSGVLTHPYLLAALSYRGASSPIHRGVFLTRNIVGRTLKSPPVAVAFNNEEFPAGLTMREKVTRLTRQPTCQGCHGVINPLGFSLEGYDAVGRHRREEAGRPIDSVSQYLTDDSRALTLSGPRDVADFALGSDRALDAFVEVLFHHAVKQPIQAYGVGATERLRRSFVAAGYSLRHLLVEIAVLGARRGLESASGLVEDGRHPR